MRDFAWILAPALLACSSSPTSSTSDAGAGEASDDAGDDGASDDAGDDGDAASPACPPGSKTGSASGGNVTAPGGLTVLVRTPPGYDATVAHPFLMVYAPAGADSQLTEQFTGYTAEGKKRGYVVAYADHVSPTDLPTIQQASLAIKTVTGKWCVNPKRIYVSGHSDGGSITEIIAAKSYATVAAIAPSAAGVSDSTFSQLGCPSAPVPVMEIHSSGDQLFPVSQGFGANVAKAWAQCDKCGPTASAPGADGCIHYTGCTSGLEVRYCEGTAAHGYWPPATDPPPTDKDIFDFLDKYAAP